MQLQLAVHLAAVLAAHALPWAGSASAAALTSAPPPFSFTLGGELFASNVATPSRSSWALQTASFAQPGGRECTDFTWTDNATGLQVTAAQTAYTGAAMAGTSRPNLSLPQAQCFALPQLQLLEPSLPRSRAFGARSNMI